MNFKLILFGCIVACLAVTQIAAQCACGAEGEDVCRSCQLIRVPRPQQPRRFPSRPNHRQNGCTCSTCSPSPNPSRFVPVGDRCTCANSAVLPANRPRSPCQVCQDANRNINNDAPCASPNLRPLANNGRGRRGMLGLFGLRGVFGQLGTPAVGVSLNSRVMPRLQTENSIVRQSTDEIDADNSIIT